jgi:hypothetical protein
LTIGRPLPVYPHRQTLFACVGMSQRCRTGHSGAWQGGLLNAPLMRSGFERLLAGLSAANRRTRAASSPRCVACRWWVPTSISPVRMKAAARLTCDTPSPSSIRFGPRSSLGDSATEARMRTCQFARVRLRKTRPGRPSFEGCCDTRPSGRTHPRRLPSPANRENMVALRAIAECFPH